MSILTAIGRELYVNRRREPKTIIVNYETYAGIMKDVELLSMVQYKEDMVARLWGIPIEVSRSDDDDLVIEYGKESEDE